MVLYFLLIFSIYFILMLLLLVGWGRVKQQKIKNSLLDVKAVSVVIAVRNEEENIDRLLRSLDAQNFPQHQFEVLIVDDNSTDRTAAKIEDFSTISDLNLQLLTRACDAKDRQSPKKAALLSGIEAAKGEIILTTDGDTWFGPDWIENMITPFQDTRIHFVSGPVVIEGNTNVSARLQALEFASLMGTGAALIGLRYPLMCNGANLAFRKSTFTAVNGYMGNQDDASGDDVYLMQKVHNTFPGSVVFSNSPDAIVRTSPQETWRDFVSQRRRWASKWNRYLLKFSWLLPVFLFIHYVSVIAAIVTMFMVPEALLFIAALLIFKIALDTIFLKKVMDFSKLSLNLVTVLIAELSYPLYALIIGTQVHFGSYSWKGRSYKH